MKFIELWKALDDIHPFWINEDGESEYFENKNDAGLKLGIEYAGRTVEYITQDAEGVLTIELKERRHE